MPARSKPINLLPPSEFEATFWGRFLRWAVTAGRYIIIVTELIVILAFLSRFKLDQDTTELVSTLEGEKNILEAQSDIEEQFRTVQSKLTAADQMLEGQMGVEKKINKIVERIPPAVKLTVIKISPSTVELNARTLSEQALGEMLLRLSKDEEIKSLEIEEVSADEKTGISALVVVKL